MVDLLDVELSLHLSTTVLDVLFVSKDLSHDKFEVTTSNFLYFFVLGVAGKLIEVWVEF